MAKKCKKKGKNAERGKTDAFEMLPRSLKIYKPKEQSKKSLRK